MSTSFTLSVDVVCRVGVSLWRPYVSTWTSGGHRCLEGRIGLLIRLGVENNLLQSSKFASKRKGREGEIVAQLLE